MDFEKFREFWGAITRGVNPSFPHQKKHTQKNQPKPTTSFFFKSTFPKTHPKWQWKKSLKKIAEKPTFRSKNDGKCYFRDPPNVDLFKIPLTQNWTTQQKQASEKDAKLITPWGDLLELRLGAGGGGDGERTHTPKNGHFRPCTQWNQNQNQTPEDFHNAVWTSFLPPQKDFIIFQEGHSPCTPSNPKTQRILAMWHHRPPPRIFNSGSMGLAHLDPFPSWVHSKSTHGPKVRLARLNTTPEDSF